MNCFNHTGTPAVGTCKACSRGLCSECAADLGHGLACRDKHETMVETYNAIVVKNAQVYAAAPKNVLIGPMFYLFMGIVFNAFGLTTHKGVDNFSVIMSIGFIAFAVVAFVRNRTMFRDNRKA